MKKLEDLQRQLSEGRITRREFMTRATALGVAAAVPSLILQEEARAMAKKGGRLRIGTTGGATSDNLDPGQTLDSMPQNVQFGQLRNCLTEISNKGELVGELAESWEASPDAKTWTFKLRKDVEFHNGKTLDADDVVYSINEHRGPDTKSAASGVVAGVTDVKADGNNVVFTLEGGNADFPALMSDYHLSIVIKGTTGAEYDKGIGTGGYTLVSWEPGVRAETKRNPNYWKEGAAHFDEVETLQLADTTARTNALRTGEIDVMNNVDLKTVHLLERTGDTNVIKSFGTKHMTFPMDTRTAPFDNNHVRLALKYAINREEMLAKILKGFGALGNDHPIGLANTYHAGDLAQRTYDIDKAKFHLKEAGLSSLKVDLSAAETAFNGAVDASVLYKEHAAPAGIEINVIREPNDGYWSNVWMAKPWCACYWSGRPTEDWMFSQVYAAGANWNDTYWDHKKFNELLLAARAELDADKRRGMYAEMQQIVSDEGGVVIPMFSAELMAATKKLAVPEHIAANWELDGHKIAERWWFA